MAPTSLDEETCHDGVRKPRKETRISHGLHRRGPRRGDRRRPWRSGYDLWQARQAEHARRIDAAALAYVQQQTTAACAAGRAGAAVALCVALAEFDAAAQTVAAWAEPQDRAPIGTVLAQVRATALLSDRHAPSWTPPLAYVEHAIGRQTRALQAAAQILPSKTSPEKAALSAELAEILRRNLLSGSN